MKQDEVEVYFVKTPEKKSIRMTKTGFDELNKRRPGLYAIKERPTKIVIPVAKAQLKPEKVTKPKRKTRQSGK